MKITNNTTNDILVSDLLQGATVQQIQDGVRQLVIPASDYVIIPNLQGCNSVTIKTLADAATITVDKTVEPTGAEPTKEIGGAIVGMASA